MKPARLLLIFLSNICVFIAGIALCELAFGDWFAKDLEAIPRSIPRNIQVRYDARKLYPTSRERITYTRDIFGLRGSHSTVKDIGILVVGGSTTDQRYIDDDATWDAVMQRDLRKRGYNITVANAGIDGQSTLGHLRSFKTWFSNIPDLRPAYVVFYLGINDSVYLREKNELQGSDAIASSNALWESVKTKSIFYQIFERLWGTYKAREYGIFSPMTIQNEEITMKNILEDANNPFSARSSDAKPGNLAYADVYEQNLLKLDALSRGMGAKAVFASQPAGTCRFEGATVLQQAGTSFDCVSLAYINKLTAEVSGRNNIPFIDVASRLTLTRPSEMYDYVHANETGARLIGEVFAERVSKSVDLSMFLSTPQK